MALLVGYIGCVIVESGAVFKGFSIGGVLGTLFYLGVSRGPAPRTAGLLRGKVRFKSLDKGWLEVQGPRGVRGRLHSLSAGVQS